MLETRLATIADATLISSHRRAMFEAMGRGTAETLDTMARLFEPWLLPRLADGRYTGWIISDAASSIASAGLLILEWPPHPLDPTGESRAYLLNVFVESAYRRRGLARELLRLCLAEAHRRGIRIVSLHASDQGRPIYESLGFRAANEMLFIDTSLG
jgi:ribosomal protein S18 acetylase RimI-like enzyme